MSKNMVCLLGLAGSILTAVGTLAFSAKIPPAWVPYLLLAAAIGTGTAGWLAKSPLNHEKDKES